MKKGIIISLALLTAFILLYVFINSIKKSEEDISSNESSTVESVQEESETDAFATISDTSQEQDESVDVAEPTSTTYIPKELLDLLSEAILSSTEVDLLQSMVSDKELTEEEIDKYKTDSVAAEYINYSNEHYGSVFLIDADNDTVHDLFFLVEDGGSMGNNSRYLLRGHTDGTFERTSFEDGLTHKLAFIMFQGKNYLIETNYDFNMKEHSGLIIKCFQNGKIVEEVYLKITADDYIVSISTSEDKYTDLFVESTKITQGDYNILDYNSVFWNDNTHSFIGRAETFIEEKDYQFYHEWITTFSDKWYLCDLNNDGQDEIYSKDVFLTSGRAQSRLINSIVTEKVNLNGQHLDIFDCYHFEPKGTPMMFWVSTVDDKNIISVITYCSITDYTETGYLIEGEAVSEVYEVKFTGKKIVKQSIYTRGINYIDYWEDYEEYWL